MAFLSTSMSPVLAQELSMLGPLTDADCMGREEIAQERLRGSGEKYMCADLSYGASGCSKGRPARPQTEQEPDGVPYWGTLRILAS